MHGLKLKSNLLLLCLFMSEDYLSDLDSVGKTWFNYAFTGGYDVDYK